jgi:hypothetical protein
LSALAEIRAQNLEAGRASQASVCGFRIRSISEEQKQKAAGRAGGFSVLGGLS